MGLRVSTADVLGFVKAFHNRITPETDIFDPSRDELASPYPGSHFVNVSTAFDDGVHAGIGFRGKNKKIHTVFSPLNYRQPDKNLTFEHPLCEDSDHIILLTGDHQLAGYGRVEERNFASYPFARQFHMQSLSSARLLLQDPDCEPFEEAIRFLLELNRDEIELPREVVVSTTRIRDFASLLDPRSFNLSAYIENHELESFPFDSLESIGIKTFGDLEKMKEIEFNNTFVLRLGFSLVLADRIKDLMYLVRVSFKS